eukprot:scaffold5731_cov119-Isochrysis_galbana.AAC.5
MGPAGLLRRTMAYGTSAHTVTNSDTSRSAPHRRLRPSVSGGGGRVVLAGPWVRPEARRSHCLAMATVLSSESEDGSNPTTATAAGGGSPPAGSTAIPRDVTSMRPLASVRPAAACARRHFSSSSPPDASLLASTAHASPGTRTTTRPRSAPPAASALRLTSERSSRAHSTAKRARSGG